MTAASLAPDHKKTAGVLSLGLLAKEKEREKEAAGAKRKAGAGGGAEGAGASKKAKVAAGDKGVAGAGAGAPPASQDRGVGSGQQPVGARAPKPGREGLEGAGWVDEDELVYEAGYGRGDSPGDE